MARKIIRNGLNGEVIPDQKTLSLKKTVKYYLNIQRAGEKIFPFVILEEEENRKYFSFEFKPPYGKSGILIDRKGIIDLFSIEKILIGNQLSNRVTEKIRNNTLICFDFLSIKGYLMIILKSKHSGKNLSSVKVPLKDIAPVLEVNNEKT